MTEPHKKPAVPFNKAADNYIKDASDVQRALAALRARKPQHLTAQEKKKAELAEHFDAYHSVVAPFIDTLCQLPAKDGMSFHARCDLYQSSRSQQDQIHVWLLYGRATDSAMLAGIPTTHDVAVPVKDNSSKQRMTHVALSSRPVLEIEMKPQNDGSHVIESRIYIERYRRKNGSDPASLPGRGDFLADNEILEQKQHPRLSGTLQALDSWLQKTVPERMAEIRAALGIHDTPVLKDDVPVMKPPTIHRRK